MTAAIQTVTCANMNPQLDHSVTYWLAVSKVAGLYLAQADSDARFSDPVTQGFEPVGERFAAILTLVAKEFIHRQTVA